MLPTHHDLRQVMRHWASGVAVLTSAHAGAAHGMTVNSFTSVSVDPPMVTVTLANDTRTRQLVEASGVFGVSILAHDQEAISNLFAGQLSDEIDRLSGLEVFTLKSAAPLLVGALAVVDCSVAHRYEMAHSTLYVAAANECRILRDAAPLAYLNRGYRKVE